MRINNAGELASFISGNGLSHLAAELPALIVCMEEYARMCGGCVDNATKAAQANKCHGLYINFVSQAQAHKAALLSKSPDGNITFTNNGQHIITLRR